MRKIVARREYGPEADVVLTIVEHYYNPGQIQSLIIDVSRVEGDLQIEVDLHMAKVQGTIESPKEVEARLADIKSKRKTKGDD